MLTGGETVNVLTRAKNDELSLLRVDFDAVFAKPWRKQGQVVLHVLYKGADVADPTRDRHLGIIRILHNVHVLRIQR